MAGIAVDGLRQLQTALAKAEDKTTGRNLRDALKDLAEPVRAAAETNARARITRIGSPWSRMRTGVTRSAVYVAPRERGVKGRDQRRRRPNLAPLLLERAMEPALDSNTTRVEAGLDRLLDQVADNFNRGA